MNELEFQSIKQMVLELKKSNIPEVNNESLLSKVSGIYMVYIDDFSDDKIIPIYIGQTDNVQRRYGDHFKELMALNRLTKEFYERYQNKLFYNGHYKTCKIFKYMIDHQCTLNDFHMLFLEGCDISELDGKEKEYIKKFSSEYFGFNQLESISTSLKPEYANMSANERDALQTEELKKINTYLDYGFNRFNFLLAYGLVDNKEDSGMTKSIKKKIRERLIDEGQVTDEVIEEYKIFLEKQQRSHKNAVEKHLIPSIDYIDFPLKNYKIDLHFPKLKKNECGIFFVISNTNRWYGGINYKAEIVKIITKQTYNQGDQINEYYIENESYNHTYYEKDDGNIFVFSKKPFQVTTSYEDIHLISLTTELKMGVNDYELRNKQFWSLKAAMNDIIQKTPEGWQFKLVSNQSKKVMQGCLLGLPYTMKLMINNERREKSNLDNLSLLLVNNNCFREKYYEESFKEEGIKIIRVNNFAKGIETALKGEYDYIVFQVNRINDRSIAAMRNLRELDTDVQIMVFNNAGINGRKAIEDISNCIVYNLNVNLKELMDMFFNYTDKKIKEKGV